MSNRYDDAANEIEARIKYLEGRIERFKKRGLDSRIPHVQAEIDQLKKIDVKNWRATGKWANEIWGNH